MDTIKPFTKWTGGKRQLLPELLQRMPLEFDNYIEPFVGGGAFFFSLTPEKAVINDINEDLIFCYISIRDNLAELIDLLEKHRENNSKEYYLKIRSQDRNENFSLRTPVERAARLMYMLRVNFNGMYRVNSKNHFNVPYGRYVNPRIVDKDNLINIHKFLNSAEIDIKNEDYEIIINESREGDFVYLDPPYAPLSETSSFTSYTSQGFSVDEQIRLKESLDRLNEKGVLFMQSNSAAPLVLDLYIDYNIHFVKASRSINSVSTRRGKIDEVLITNYTAKNTAGNGMLF